MPLEERANAEGEVSAPFFLERGARLSRSILWRLQRAFFHRAGIDAWSAATVPHYVTNNPALAHAYADVALGFLRDRRAVSRDEAEEPFTIVELGSGSGRFAYLFLRELEELLAVSSFADVRFRYVMTDFTETNLAFWRSHPALRPFVERGVLDFALFDAEHDAHVRLERSGETLGPGSLREPVMVIANYVFDGISQDAFSFEGGGIRECLVSLSSDEPVSDPAEPQLIERLTLSYEQRPTAFDYYDDPIFNDILRGYAETMVGATVLFPSAALECVRRLAEIASGRLLLLSGDRGEIHPEALAESEDLGVGVHGSFSVPFNFDAMRSYVLRCGGHALTAPHRHVHLNVSAFVLGEHQRDWAETRLAFRNAFERGGPDDFFTIRRGILTRVESLDGPQILSFVRASHHDPRVLRDCLAPLWQAIADAPDALRREIRRVIPRVWQNYYHIREELDLAFELGLLLHALGENADALAMFDESTRLYGDDARTRWNMGLCHYGLGRIEDAVRCFAEASRLDPAFSPRGALQIKSELG